MMYNPGLTNDWDEDFVGYRRRRSHSELYEVIVISGLLSRSEPVKSVLSLDVDH